MSNLGKVGKVRSIASLAGEVVMVDCIERFIYDNGTKTDKKEKVIQLSFTVLNDKNKLEAVILTLKADYSEELEKKSKLLEGKNIKGNVNVYVSKDYKKSYSIENLEVLKVQ